MRLTLRTLLAYLDGVLEEDEALALKEKIDGNEFAKRLESRILELVKKRQIPIPKIYAKGTSEANTVAEYLDNTLSPERVASIERDYLESDSRLAEIAECHQILTQYIQQAPDCPSKLKKRIFRIGKPVVDSSSSSEDFGEALDKRGSNPEDFELSKPSSKDYAKVEKIEPAPERKPLPIVPVMGVLASLFLLALLIVWSVIQNRPTDNTLPDDAKAVSSVDGSPDQNRSKTEASQPAGTSILPIGKGSVFSVTQGTGPKQLPDASAAEVGTTNKEVTVNKPTIEKLDSGKTDSGKAKQQHRMVQVIDVIPPDPITKSTFDIAMFGLADTKPNGNLCEIESAKELLVKFDQKRRFWTPVREEWSTQTNEYLLSFPIYRPTLKFGDVRATFAGPGIHRTIVSKKGIAGLAVEYGRLKITSAKNLPREFRIQTERVAGTLTLSDTDSLVAIDVHKQWQPGTDLRSNPATTIVQIMCVRGSCIFEDDSTVSTIDAGNVKLFLPDDQIKEGLVERFPSWSRQEEAAYGISMDDKSAVISLLKKNDSVSNSLKSMIDKKILGEKKVAETIANLCRSQLLDLEASLEIFNQAGSYAKHWRTVSRQLRQNAAVSQESAMAISNGLEKVRTEDAKEIFHSIVGYSDTQLADGYDKQLVDFLLHKEQLLRVVALDNLRRITGQSLMFRPETSEKTRINHYKRWREKLNKGEIRSNQDLPKFPGVVLISDDFE